MNPSLRIAENVGRCCATVVGLLLVVVSFLQYGGYSQQTALMQIEERPWIKVDIAPVRLVYDPKTGDGHLYYSATIKNVGHTVATSTTVDAELFSPCR
jgi:hypothetical protein